MTEKTCSNCYWNVGDDCYDLEDSIWMDDLDEPCPGWRPIGRPDSDDDGEPD